MSTRDVYTFVNINLASFLAIVGFGFPPHPQTPLWVIGSFSTCHTWRRKTKRKNM
jgi:hypothetical protein